MKKSTLYIVLISLLAAFSLQGAVGDDICGPWHGVLDVGGAKLPLVINLSDSAGTLSATIDSPDQKAFGIPAEATVNDCTLNVEIKAIGATYTGSISNKNIDGAFTQQGMKFPLVLERGPWVPDRPQTPQPPYPYKTEEISFINPIDSTLFHGTLTLPLKYFTKGATAVPAVVMVTGSGIQNRDEELFGHRPFAVIAHHLALEGIASLRYDDRGFGTENPDPDATTASYASDAEAALAYMRAKADFKSTGVLGHSEGGTIAFILAAEGKPDFIISLAGSALPGDSILILQNKALLEKMVGEHVTTEYITGLRLLFDYMKGHPDAREWPDKEQATAALSNLPGQLRENYSSIISSRNRWLDYFLTFDPRPAISATQCPVMAINGELDMQVDCNANLDAIRDNLPEDIAEKSLIKSYPGLNHLLQHAITGLPMEYNSISETISPEVLDDIAKWIKR